MTLFDAIVLGLIQGLTEFLPVSSSGHLVLAQKLLHIELDDRTMVAFDVLLHQATLVAVLVFFRRDLVPMTKQFFALALSGPGGWKRARADYPLGHFAFMVGVATVPAVVAGFTLEDFFDELFGSGQYLWAEFALTTALLVVGQRALGGGKRPGEFGLWEAAVIGLLQAVAILPAVSRSGATIAGALVVGLERETAARFSFLMSIPALLGAGVLKGKAMVWGLESGAISPTAAAAGFVISGVVGFLSLGLLVRIIKGQRLYVFALYTGLLAAGLLAAKFMS